MNIKWLTDDNDISSLKKKRLLLYFLDIAVIAAELIGTYFNALEKIKWPGFVTLIILILVVAFSDGIRSCSAKIKELSK